MHITIQNNVGMDSEPQSENEGNISKRLSLSKGKNKLWFLISFMKVVL